MKRAQLSKPVPFDQVLAALVGELAATRAMVERLQQELLMMKREGFTRGEELGTLIEQGPELPVDVLDAIEQRAFDSATRRDLTRFAVIALDKGEDPLAVAKRILEGDGQEFE